MNFALSDDQRMLQDTVERLVLRDYGFEQRKAYAAEPGGWSRQMWRTLAEMGLLAESSTDSIADSRIQTD
jgi:alkylation response protein AidB-like acyl-CoA dehydrogenase